jgi:hypothetical protein
MTMKRQRARDSFDRTMAHSSLSPTLTARVLVMTASDITPSSWCNSNLPRRPILMNVVALKNFTLHF